MKTLQEATLKICDLTGGMLALETALIAVLQVLSKDQQHAYEEALATQSEACKALLLGAALSEQTLTAFERDVHRLSARVG